MPTHDRPADGRHAISEIAAKLPLVRVRRRCLWALDRTLTVLNRMLMFTGICTQSFTTVEGWGRDTESGKISVAAPVVSMQ